MVKLLWLDWLVNESIRFDAAAAAAIVEVVAIFTIWQSKVDSLNC